MGIESRDWYRDWWRKKTNYQERAKFRLPASEEARATDKDHEKGSEYLDNAQGPPDLMEVDLHWSLKLLVLLIVFVAIMAIRKLVR